VIKLHENWPTCISDEKFFRLLYPRTSLLREGVWKGRERRMGRLGGDGRRGGRKEGKGRRGREGGKGRERKGQERSNPTQFFKRGCAPGYGITLPNELPLADSVSRPNCAVGLLFFFLSAVGSFKHVFVVGSILHEL
jgi:hypothetical protein